MMRGWLIVTLWLCCASSVAAQPGTIGPDALRCADCASTGQHAATGQFDASQVEFVEKVIPPFFDNRTLRTEVIARVLNAAPLMLEMIDARLQVLDRSMRVIQQSAEGGSSPPGCGEITRIAAVDLASKPVISTLRLNDVVTGGIMMNRDEQLPGSMLAGKAVLTNVRRTAGPVRLFNPPDLRCHNRSGTLVHYTGADGETQTVIYNDGAIHHHTAASVWFRREKLSSAELGDLLRAFRAVNFDANATTFVRPDSSARHAVTLIGLRYQRVAIGEGDIRLSAILRRLDALADRAMSRARYVLKRGNAVPITVIPWPHPEIDLATIAVARGMPATPAEWDRSLPDDLLRLMPVDGHASNPQERNRTVFFSQHGKLYRVATHSYCLAGTACTFRGLNAAEVTEPLTGDCPTGTTSCQTTIFPGGRKENRRTDPDLAVLSGRVWPQVANVRLRDVPPAGLTFDQAEYNRLLHLYMPLVKRRTSGAPFIEDGFLYENVRACPLDDGAAESCEVLLPSPPFVQ